MVYNMDCLEGMKKLSDNSIDLIITDPPYGVEFSKGFNDSKETVSNNIDLWLKEMYRVLKPTCHCYIYIPTKEAAMWLTNIEKNFDIYNILSTRTYTKNTYIKNNFQFNSQLIVYCSKGVAKKFNDVDFIRTSESWLKDKRNKNPKEFIYLYPAFITECYSSKWCGKNTGYRHPCAKSVKLIEFFIKLSSNEGDIVLDPFAGGGSVVVAAENTNRNYIAYELNKEYYDYILSRIKKEENTNEK